MTGSITRDRDIESLQTAARWPGADRATTVVLAIRLAAARADAEGYRYFCELAGARPGEALPLALAGFFQARLGVEVDAALAKLDQAAATGLGPPQYFRGLALAGLPPDRRRAARAIADLEFVLAVRDQFPPMLLRAAYHGLAAAHAALGHDAQAAEAGSQVGARRGPGRHAADVRRLLGHRRRRVPLHLAQDLAPGTRYPGRPGLRLRRSGVHHDQRRRGRDRRRNHPGPGQGRGRRP